MKRLRANNRTCLLRACVLLACVVLSAAAQAQSAPPIRGPKQKMTGVMGEQQWGWASFYHPSLHGLTTSSGDRYDKHALSGAHPNIPLGTIVKITNKKNGRSVIVEINDRLPPLKRRIVDLSSAAARELGMLRRGVTPVRLEVIGESVRPSALRP